MHIYSTSQWALLFYFYCLCGWIWESCYVSAKQRKWINRGFLRGPLLPIYGSGAIIVLFVTLPVEHNLYLVYLFGTLAATVLEYVVGAVMERLFTVRYWDYSYQKLNLHGYICLSSSIAWGFFSILMVRYIHPPVGRLLARLPAVLIDPLAFAITILFTVDFVTSFQAAMDLRDTLARLTEENEDLRRLAKRAEVLVAFAEDDLHQFRERTALNKELLQAHLEAERSQHRAVKEMRKKYRHAILEDALQRRLQAKLDIIATITETLERARASLEGNLERDEVALAAHRAELEALIRRIRAHESAVRTRTTKRYQTALRILESNPTAKARKDLGEAMEVLRNVIDQK